ncbi:MAG: GNAT family N-acetyltransferase [Clostridiales bacterium]|nr:GNAT family N-acetyltransferase [Clostridiales bacterium]
MKVIKTKNPRFTIRFAVPGEAGIVLKFMKKLGQYQKMSDKIIATEKDIYKLLSDKKGEAIFGNYDGKTIAFIYFCRNSSAFIGQTGIYIDGFYVDEIMRFKGLGKIMMSFMSRIAIESGCRRLEWGCLNWNTSSIKFYENRGAVAVDTMTVYRLSPDKLKENAALF